VSEEERTAALLAVARDVLRGEIASGLEEQQRYAAAMVANAMAIATRQLREGETARRREQTALGLALGDGGTAELDDLRGRLVEEIRAGRYDDPQADHFLRPMLRARVEARLAISNPDYRV
jgi:hypothetical protein